MQSGVPGSVGSIRVPGRPSGHENAATVMIHIADYDPAWPSRFVAEAANLRRVLGDLALRVEHVGSTSVPGLAAKPVIDIQVSVATLEPRSLYLEPLASLGYRHIPLGSFDLVYPFFQKPTEWPCTHHVHLCVRGSTQERDHLAFRDYLRSHASAAAEYLELKRGLALRHHGATQESREGYSLAKSDFVAAVLGRAFVEGSTIKPLVASGEAPMDDRNKLFISYSHEDTKWLEAIKEQLAVLEAEGLISLCDDTQLKVGEAWYPRLNEMMLSARLGLLLISAPFLSSKFVREEEIPRLFGQHQQGGMRLYPLLVRPCPWERVEWLARLQLRPQDTKRRARALSSFAGAAREQVIVDVANEIAGLVRP